MDEALTTIQELSPLEWNQMRWMQVLISSQEGGNLSLANEAAKQLGILLNGDNGHNRVETGVFNEEQI